jgi:nucleoside-diphosphate-sugar epimerase
MKILVTGGAGFLGSALVTSLAKNKTNTVSIFDNYTHGFPKKFPSKKNIESPLSGNIRHLHSIIAALEKFKPDVVVHLAAFVTRPEVLGDFKTCAEVNYLGSANLMKACNDVSWRPKRVVFASSLAALTTPDSHFGISKRASERLLGSLCRHLDIDYVGLRFSEIFGVSDSPTSDSEIHFLIDNMLRGRNIAVYGEKQHRDYIHISDAVVALELAINNPNDRTYVNMDVGSGKPTVTVDLVKTLSSLVKYKGQIKFWKDPRINIGSFVADISTAEMLLGFRCEKDFNTGLKELVSRRRKELKWKT